MKVKVILILMLVLAGIAVANQSPLKLSMEAYKVWDSLQATDVFLPLEETGVVPGDEILFAIIAENTFSEPILNPQIQALIPEGTEYVQKSATGDHEEILEYFDSKEASPVELYFSIDGGNSFHVPPIIYEYEISGITVKKIASPDMYTHIMWKYNGLLKYGEKLIFIYKVRVKEN